MNLSRAALGKTELIRKEGCAGWALAKAAQIRHSNATTKTSSENCTSILRSVTRDLARALSPHSRGCWSSAHDPRPFIPVPLAACGKAFLECRLTGEAH